MCGGDGAVSAAALAAYLGQASALEAQEVVHAVFRAVDPFLDIHLVTKAVAVDHFPVTEKVAADRLAAFAQHLCAGRRRADQRTAATVGGGRLGEHRQAEQRQYKAESTHGSLLFSVRDDVRWQPDDYPRSAGC